MHSIFLTGLRVGMVAGCCLLVCSLMLNVHLLGTPSGDSTSVVLINLLVPFFCIGIKATTTEIGTHHKVIATG